MAILANSTRTPTVQPLLRATGPCRVLTDVDVVALTSKAVLSLNVLTAETLDMLDAIEPESARHAHASLTAPLPSLGAAFRRRQQIFGAHHG